MIIDRRSFLKSAALVSAGSPASHFAGPHLARAASAQFSYKFGTSLPANHPLCTRTEDAARAILDETDGRVDIKVFPNQGNRIWRWWLKTGVAGGGVAGL